MREEHGSFLWLLKGIDSRIIDAGYNHGVFWYEIGGTDKSLETESPEAPEKCNRCSGKGCWWCHHSGLNHGHNK